MYNYKENEFSLELNKSGSISDFKYKDVQITACPISVIDNSVFNIHIVSGENSFGILDTDVKKTITEDLSIQGSHNGIDFNAKINLLENGKFTIGINLSEEADIVFATDICLGDASIRSNILYASQYLDNKVFETETGYAVAMRKTVKQSMGYPYIQISADKKVVEYATEGYDFYTSKFRYNQKLELSHELSSRARNYEHGFIALKVKGEKEVKFCGAVLETLDHQIDKLIEINNSQNSNSEEPSGIKLYSTSMVKLLNGLELSQVEIDSTYPVQNFKEVSANDKLYSFFTNNHEHVILQEKELYIDRTHANIITSGNHDVTNRKQLVSSNYMCGVFNAQLAIGNTAQNPLNSNISSGLYINKLQGTRIFVKEGEELLLLNTPSVYELGFNYSKWVYKLEDNTITVKVFTEMDTPNLNFVIESEKNIDVVITDDILPKFTRIENEFLISNGTYQKEIYPNLKYKYSDELSYEENEFGENIVAFTKAVDGSISFQIKATLDEEYSNSNVNFNEEVAKYENYIEELARGIQIKADDEAIEMFNTTIRWYIHNGLIHFATPHGVEQHGGAAWGTRDVCQGPVELFASLGHYDMVRKILLEIFRNQSIQTGNWPQWFMFDDYRDIRSDEQHGDVIVWPLKALADYLNETNDISILEEKVEYYDEDTKLLTGEEYTIMHHVKNEIGYIEANFIEGTYLSKYADGDWDDTLQPAKDEDRNKMVSGWTVALTYQAFKNISKYIKDEVPKIDELIEGIKCDYNKYLVKNGAIAGFIKYNSSEDIDYILHPEDNKTGLKHRLLPINRGIISGLIEGEEIANQMKIIEEKLACPDGIRLMDKPAKYTGGESHLFQRAESASTVGREVSLQYVHAHIRYIEAMCKIQNVEQAWWGLKIINPLMVNEMLEQANLRQRNAYFSSSDGDFDNRYDYEENFDKLRTGDITIKSGWRIYSSGPGIYLKQLLSNFLEYNFKEKKLENPERLNGIIKNINVTSK